MKIDLTHKLGKAGNLYKGEISTVYDGRLAVIESLILATNTEEAMAKLKEFMSQERPSLDQDEAAFLISPDYLID